MNPRPAATTPSNSSGPGTAAGHNENKGRVADLALCAWFVLTGVAFWGPYAGVALPFNLLTALYAAFLLFFIADAALRLLRGAEPKAAEAVTPPPPLPTTTPAAQGKRRGK